MVVVRNYVTSTTSELSICRCSLGDGLWVWSIDQTTAFEWQRHMQGISEVPHDDELLKLLDLQAQASESTTCKSAKHSAQNVPRKKNVHQKLVYFATAVNSLHCNMVQPHSLYTCVGDLDHCHMTSTFKAVKDNQFCFVCLKSGHLKPQCPWLERSQQCQRYWWDEC